MMNPTFGTAMVSLLGFNRLVAWSSGASLTWLVGKAVRLRFVLQDVDLYSLRIVP